MTKTRLFLGASLIALAIGSISTVQAGFDRAKDYTANLGNNANAGAYYNPYLSGQNHAAPPQQQQTRTNAQPNGYSLFRPSPYGGFNIGPFGAHTPFGGFNIGPFSAHSPFGGFNIGPFSASSPFGGFNIGGHSPIVCITAPCPGGFNLGPVGAHTPWGGFNLGPFGAHTPFGGFNLGPVSASSPWGGFGFMPFPLPMPYPLPGGGFNLGQMPQGGYAPQPSGMGGQPQPVSCSINAVPALTRSVSDCEKAGGQTVAANTR